MLTPVAAPIVLGVSAAAAWGAADFTGGLATRRAAPGRVVFAAHGTSLVLLGVFLVAAHRAPLSGLGWGWGLLSGVSGGIALMLFYEALAAGAMGLSAALAGVLTAALPVAVSVTRQGPPAARQIAGFAVAAAAIVLIAWSPEMPARADAPAPGTSARSLALSALAGLGFGVQLLVLHLASAQGTVVGALALSRAGGAAAGAGAMLLAALRGRAGKKQAAVPGPATQKVSAAAGLQRSPAPFFALAALAGLLDTTGNGLYMGAALVGRMDVAAVLSSLYPGATILLAMCLLKERATWLQAAGMALALAAVALIAA